MVFSKTLITSIVSLIALHAISLNAAMPDSSKKEAYKPNKAILSAFFRPEKILEHIKMRCNKPAEAQNFTNLLELDLINIYQSTLADIIDHEGCNVLHRACNFGHADVVQVLVATAFNDSESISKQNNWGMTPLMLAIFHGHQLIVDILMNKLGNDFKKYMFQLAGNGRTVFHHAARAGNKECFDSLMQKAIDGNTEHLEKILTMKDGYGNTLLHIATNKLRSDVKQSILEYADMAKITEKLLAIRNNNGKTPPQTTLFLFSWI